MTARKFGLENVQLTPDSWRKKRRRLSYNRSVID